MKNNKKIIDQLTSILEELDNGILKDDIGQIDDNDVYQKVSFARGKYSGILTAISLLEKKENDAKFIEACISSGKYVETGLNLPQDKKIMIEDILSKNNDKVAKTKIRKIIK